jgi:hypothetical protein
MRKHAGRAIRGRPIILVRTRIARCRLAAAKARPPGAAQGALPKGASLPARWQAKGRPTLSRLSSIWIQASPWGSSRVAPPKSGLPKPQSIAGVGLAPIGMILDNFRNRPIVYKLHTEQLTSFIPSTGEAPMSFRAKLLSDIPYYAAEIPWFLRTREWMSNISTFHAIMPRGGPKKGKSGTILQIPC